MAPSPYFAERFYEKFKNSKYNYKKQEIIKEARIFVETKVYKQANKILNDKNIILIHGQPGAGKTMLARRLALKYIYQNYEFRFENAVNIKEIEDYLYDGKKRVIIIDDFLGETTLELKGLSDNKLYDIICYAKKNKNIKLILTTRTYIYNNAKQILEKFAHTSERLEKLLIEVNEYTPMDKAKILYNHLYYNHLLWSTEYLEIIEDRYYQNIIYHINFTPRNIEQICEIIREDKTLDNVTDTISSFLDNPERIWSHEYAKLDKSIYGKYEKILLDLICFLKYQVEEENLKTQFEKIVANKEGYDEYIFYKSLDELSNAFISTTFNKKGKKVYKLANPSMGDFLRLKAKKCKNTVKNYIQSIDSVEGIHDFYDLFSEDLEMKKLVRQRIENIIEQKIPLSYFDKRLIGFMLDKNLTKLQENLIEKLVDKSYKTCNQEDAVFILDILDHEQDTYMYNYMLKKFREYEIEGEKTKRRLIHYLEDTFDWNIYLGACQKVLKRKNSNYMMNLEEYMIDELIYCISIETEELMGDSRDEIIERYQKGENVDEICLAFVDWSLSDLENLEKVYTQEHVDYIIETVKANCEAYLEEEELQEEIEKRKESKKIEQSEKEDSADIISLFEKSLSKEEFLHEYFRNNITNEKSTEMLWKQKDKWYIQKFLEDNKSLKLLTEFINQETKNMKNAVIFGERLIKYLIKENIYANYKIQIEEIAYEMLTMNQDAYLEENNNLHGKEEVIDILLQAGILIKEGNKTRFLNQFFVIYFGVNKIRDKMTLEEIVDKAYEWQEGQATIEILNMYSYTNLKQFNQEYLLPNLYYYIAYTRGKDKYTIAKSLINKLKPTVYIAKYNDFRKTFGMGDNELNYIGINFDDNLMNFSYWKIRKYLEKYYFIKQKQIYKITFKKVIRDEKAIKEFDKVFVWDCFKKMYEKTNEIFLKIQEKPNIDAYNFLSNQRICAKYLDKDKRRNIEKYNEM